MRRTAPRQRDGLRTRPGQHQLPVRRRTGSRWRNCCTRPRFFDLPPRLPLVEIVPGDVLQEITVGNNEVTRTVVYEREGARRPKELDEIVSLLERLAGWQTIAASPAPLPRSAVPTRWTPTGTVPPLGGGAVRPTESYLTARARRGHRPGRDRVLPDRADRPARWPAARRQLPLRPAHRRLPAAVRHRSSTPVRRRPWPTPGTSGSKKWILIGLVAVLVIVGGATAALLPDPVDAHRRCPRRPRRPASTATADGRDVDGHLVRQRPGRPDTRCAAAARTSTPGWPPSTPRPTWCRASTTTPSRRSNSAGLTSAPSATVYVTIDRSVGPGRRCWSTNSRNCCRRRRPAPATTARAARSAATPRTARPTASSSATTRTASTSRSCTSRPTADKDAYLERDWRKCPDHRAVERRRRGHGQAVPVGRRRGRSPYIITTFNDAPTGDVPAVRALEGPHHDGPDGQVVEGRRTSDPCAAVPCRRPVGRRREREDPRSVIGSRVIPGCFRRSGADRTPAISTVSSAVSNRRNRHVQFLGHHLGHLLHLLVRRVPDGAVPDLHRPVQRPRRWPVGWKASGSSR